MLLQDDNTLNRILATSHQSLVTSPWSPVTLVTFMVNDERK